MKTKEDTTKAVTQRQIKFRAEEWIERGVYGTFQKTSNGTQNTSQRRLIFFIRFL